jgi:hypothetical protein
MGYFDFDTKYYINMIVLIVQTQIEAKDGPAVWPVSNVLGPDTNKATKIIAF